MTRASGDAILRAVAKTVAWELYSAAGYCRERAPVNLDRFERELHSAMRGWRSTHRNLNRQRRKNDGQGKI
jgi:hypothetical protein